MQEQLGYLQLAVLIISVIVIIRQVKLLRQQIWSTNTQNYMKTFARTLELLTDKPHLDKLFDPSGNVNELGEDERSVRSFALLNFKSRYTARFA